MLIISMIYLYFMSLFAAEYCREDSDTEILLVDAGSCIG